MPTTRTIGASVPAILLALLGFAGCTSPKSPSPPPAPVAVRHIATPGGELGEAADAAGVSVEVSSVETDDGAHASLVVAGVTVSEELWVNDVYYQRMEGSKHVFGDDRWLAFDLRDPDEAALADDLSLGLRRLAERGGTHEIEPGLTVDLVVRRVESDDAPVLQPPPAPMVLPVSHLSRTAG